MKIKILQIVLILVILSCKDNHQGKQKIVQEAAEIELEWLENWFNAWELVSQNTLKLPESQPPILFFCDKKFVYTTSEISAPKGVKFNGPKYFSKSLPWLKQTHNDTLTIPDGQKVPIQHMTFAASSEKEGVESFFVMAAPSFWKSIGLENEDVGLDKMLTGIFLHEFTHTREMNGIAPKLIAFEKNYNFDFDVNDDIIQNYFSNDSIYIEQFNKETELFYAAAKSKDIVASKEMASQALILLKKRQQTYLKPKKAILIEMDHVFLSMEGIGQYVMVRWLSDPKGGNVTKEVAIKSARRNKKWWSQDEGLGLILAYERLVDKPNWKLIFNKNPENIVTMLERELQQ